MSELIEYIEDYFENRLDGEEKHLFEARCVKDESFARDVAFYIAQRKVLKEELLRQKVAFWTEGESKEGRGDHPAPIRKLKIRRWIPYAVAASVLLAVLLYFTQNSPSPRRLAGEYIATKYSHLSQTMDGSVDSLQQGIAAYNNKDYPKALLLFASLYKAHPGNRDALKYAGIVYLRTKNYVKALETFEELAHAQGMLSNPGLFLQAVTLLQRNAPGDKKLAKESLETVVQQQLEGSEVAAAWLHNF
ncbi:MAG TPA: tetratricopeptide repeat protein [Puia sp.]|nr:tetratricopeptide repeat protein [Puia sp.]